MDDGSHHKKAKGTNVNENKIEHNKNWSYTSDHPYRVLIIGGSGSGKKNVLLNLIENQPDIDKIYLCAKDPYEVKFKYLINKRECTGEPYSFLVKDTTLATNNSLRFRKNIFNIYDKTHHN